MKKLTIFLGVLLLCSIQHVSATDVSGTISGNTTWTAANSPYVVTSSITVNHGVTLTIESGVTVKFDNSQSLYLNGKLIANNVIFTSNNGSPTPGIWGQIQVGNGTVSDSGNLTLTSCQVLYATQMYVENGKATLSNTDMTNFSNHGVLIETAGTLNMTGGNINTTKDWAANYGSGVLANTGAHASLTNVNIQHFQNGVGLNAHSKITINGLNVTNCNWPITYLGSADITNAGTNTLAGNGKNVIYMNFYEFSDTLTLPLMEVSYYFPNGCKVNESGRLVVASGNILKFSDNTGLEIYGTMLANASVGNAIYFTSYRDDNWGGDSNGDGTVSAPGTGNWNGIRFQDVSNDTYSVLRRCNIRYAGAGNLGGICTFNASPTIDYCDLSNNYFGVYMQYASNPLFTNNTIGSSSMTPIAMSFEANPTFSNNTLSFSDNEYDAIGLIGGTLSANATLKKRSVTSVSNITYFLLSHLTVPAGKTLTINKGIVIKSYADSWNSPRIAVSGTLNAIATADSMITFTSARDDNFGNPGDCNKDGTMTSPAIGDWGGIVFNPGATGTISYCNIKYAKASNYGFASCSTTEYVNGTAIATIDASPTISNCIFKDLDHAISCYRASNPVISNNQMINITYTPINISGTANPTMTGITFTNVGWRAIGLLGGNVCLNGTIKKRDLAGFTNITYVLLSNMTINSSTNVNVEAGVVVKVNDYTDNSDHGNIYVDGGFKTDGTSNAKVVFTSIKDDNEGNPFDSNGDGNATSPVEGSWGSIKYRSTSDDAYNILNYTSLKYGGNDKEGGLTFENASGQMKNSSISNSLNYGVYCNGNSTPTIDNVTIQNCKLDPIAMSLTANPTFANITFISNFSQAIKIIEGTLSSNALLATRNVAGITNIAYVISNLNISSNAKLTIQPDVVIKFRQDDWCGWWAKSPLIQVYGNLIANGTVNNKIYFTSFADDSKGGDSNNDGNTTTPAKGNWGSVTTNCDNQIGGIRFLSNSTVSDTVNSLKYCEISYADGGVRTESSHITMDNCIIQQCNYGAVILGSSNPDIKNTQFYNITYSPIQLSLFSSPTFTNCSALNVGYMALSVYPETYSQSATVPIRSFAGYANIPYFMESACTINSGTTITIPAGIVFKSENNNIVSSTANGFIVNGRLNIQGTVGNPVVFTNAKDDTYGNPADMNQDGSASMPLDGNSWGQGWTGTWLTFNDVSDDASSIDYAVFKYGEKGIATLSASPTINHSRFEQMYYGVDMNGVSAPKLDNSTFHNLQYYPIQISLVSYPTTSANNVITGTTYKAIKVKDETLTQDVTLLKRSFGGVTNIAYYFERYTVGTGATLTVNPGIVCKFRVKGNYQPGGQIDIFKGFKALGGSTADSNIVFTSIKDDFYGGDSNSDSLATKAEIGDWDGILFEGESLDPLCSLKSCVIRFAEKGIATTNASPTVTKCNFNNNNYGVYAAGSSNPVFSYCDLKDNYYYGINNVDKSFIIKAENCWWGTNAGPVLTNTPGNGSSEQDLVTDNVDYTPWISNGINNALMGDVSLNGLVQAYDASLILKHTVGSITLTAAQQKVADVTASSGITAYDASLILQYAVGIIQSFPAEKNKNAYTMYIPDAQIAVGNANGKVGENLMIPLMATHISGMTATEIRLHYNPQYMQFVQLANMQSDMSVFYSNDIENGVLRISMAGINALGNDVVLAQLSFKALSPVENTALSIDRFLANETDATSKATQGLVSIAAETTGISALSSTQEGIQAIYPNPSAGDASLTYNINGSEQAVKIELFSIAGQHLSTIVDRNVSKGTYTVSLANLNLDNGIYIIRMTTDRLVKQQMFQIVK